MTKLEKFNKIKDMVLHVVELMDTKDRYNYTRYSAMFDMWEKDIRKGDFSKFEEFCNWCNDPKKTGEVDHTIYIRMKPFEDPSLENILKALNYINVPAEEYVYFKLGDNRGYVRSKYKIPTGYINIKRMEQLLSKKNKYSHTIEQRNIKTGQVTGSDKISAYSDIEANYMITNGYDKIIDEFYGPRSSSESERIEMQKEIYNNGYVSLADVKKKKDVDSQVALNTLSVYMLASGFKTDLIMNSIKLPYTIKKEIGKK